METPKVTYREVKFRSGSARRWHKVFFKIQEKPELKVLSFIDSHGNEDFQAPFSADSFKRVFNCESWQGQTVEFISRKCREATYVFYRDHKFAH